MSSERGSRSWFVVVPVMLCAMFVALVVGRTHSPNEEPIPEWVAPLIAVMLVASLVAWLLMPLVRAFAKRIEMRALGSDTLDDLAQIRARLVELELSEARVLELEERVDFAERLLARRNEMPDLPLHRTPV